MIDQTLNSLGQDYFKSGYLLVGNVDYANYRTTTGANPTLDTSQLQAALDFATANASIKEVRVIDNLALVANAAYTETLGGFSRKIAVRLRDNVKLIIADGGLISFKSGGNSGATFTAALGNFGNLSNAQVICEGNNAFDGLSTTAGTLGSRFGAIDIDCRSNSCTTLMGNRFIISGRRTAGALVKTYNSNAAGTSIAKHNRIEILNADSCLSAFLVERKGEYFDIEASNIVNSLSHGAEIKDAVLNSSARIHSMTGSVGQGLKIWIDTAVTTTFNELDVQVDSIETSGEHNIFIQGMNGTLKAQVYEAQKSGIHFENVSLAGTNYYNSKIILEGIISRNNNKSGSTFSGIAGIARYVQINGFDVSDDQVSPTQYRGIDFSNSACDYIVLLGGQSSRNTNANINITGLNSFVHRDVLAWSNQKEVTGTETITDPKDIYLLTNGDTIKLPKFSLLDPDLPLRHTIAVTSGTASLAATQEDDLSYKQIGNYAAGATISLTSGQSVQIIKTASKWEILGDTTVSVLSVASLTSSATPTISGTTTFYTVTTTGADWSKTLPLAGDNIGKTFEFHKISSDFYIATFNISGSDKIQVYGTPANPPTTTSIKMSLPNERMRLTASAAGVWRAEFVRDLTFMETVVYRATSNVTGIPNGTTAFDFNATLRDTVASIDATYGYSLASEYYTVPVTGDYETDVSGFFSTSGTLTADLILQKASASAPTTFDIAEYGSQVYASSSAIAIFLKINRKIRLQKGDRLKASVRNLTVATTLTLNFENGLSSNILEPIGSYFRIRLIEPLY